MTFACLRRHILDCKKCQIVLNTLFSCGPTHQRTQRIVALQVSVVRGAQFTPHGSWDVRPLPRDLQGCAGTQSLVWSTRQRCPHSSTMKHGSFLAFTVFGGQYFEHCIAVLLHFAWMHPRIRLYCQATCMALMTVTHRLYTGVHLYFNNSVSRVLSCSEDILYGSAQRKTHRYIVYLIHRGSVKNVLLYAIDSCVLLTDRCITVSVIPHYFCHGRVDASSKLHPTPAVVLGLASYAAFHGRLELPVFILIEPGCRPIQS